ncbi:MAG: RNA recognition motif domain-containing protein [Candidatus Binatia bacterium]
MPQGLKASNQSLSLRTIRLPYSVTEGRLQEIFSAHGSVESADLISDKFTGQSRGFAFMEMSPGGED